MTPLANQSIYKNPSLFSRKISFLKSKLDEKRLAKTLPPSWWTPVWRGLIADPGSKHRKEMGSSVWIYLYLLTYSNRKTGIVRRTQEAMRMDTGYPIRTIQSQLHKLKTKGYITTEHSGRYLKITIAKWKGFGNPKLTTSRSLFESPKSPQNYTNV